MLFRSFIMLEKISAANAQQTPTRNRLYLYTDDVSSMRHFLKAKGYDVGPMLKTDYMEEFDLLDPDGQRLTIGQRNT